MVQIGCPWIPLFRCTLHSFNSLMVQIGCSAKGLDVDYGDVSIPWWYKLDRSTLGANFATTRFQFLDGTNWITVTSVATGFGLRFQFLDGTNWIIKCDLCDLLVAEFQFLDGTNWILGWFKAQCNYRSFNSLMVQIGYRWSDIFSDSISVSIPWWYKLDLFPMRIPMNFLCVSIPWWYKLDDAIHVLPLPVHDVSIPWWYKLDVPIPLRQDLDSVVSIPWWYKLDYH